MGLNILWKGDNMMSVAFDHPSDVRQSGCRIETLAGPIVADRNHSKRMQISGGDAMVGS